MSPIAANRAQLYGTDWDAFSIKIRFGRAKGRCECRGECRAPGCEKERAHGRCPCRHGELLSQYSRGCNPFARVVLTTAHLCHDEACRDETHVRAMCQRCHLAYDLREHQRRSSENRDARAGQERLL